MTDTRILLVVGRVAGGAGRHVHELASGLHARGWRVRVVCPAAVASQYDFQGLGVDVVPVEIGSRPNPRSDARALAALRTAMDATDLVHAHGLRAGSLAALALIRHTSSIPLAVTLHNAAPEGALQRLIFIVMQLLVARRAEVVLAVSPDLAGEMRQLGAREVRSAVVAAAPLTAPVRTPQEVRRELGAPEVLALTVARLAPQKDIDLLLDALSAQAPSAGFLLVIAGDGPDRARLEERVRRDGLPVRFLGARADVPDLLAAADFVVSSARWEGQPVWLQEAIQADCPVVATDVGGTRSIVGDAALLVPHGDRDTLGAAIARVAQHQNLRNVLALRANSQARALPDREAAITAVERTYLDMLGGRAPGPARDDVG